MLIPNTDNSDNVYISSSLDPTSHFEGATAEVNKFLNKFIL
jgi:RAB protein geranylgeranyltransferase component A